MLERAEEKKRKKEEERRKREEEQRRKIKQELIVYSIIFFTLFSILGIMSIFERGSTQSASNSEITENKPAVKIADEVSVDDFTKIQNSVQPPHKTNEVDAKKVSEALPQETEDTSDTSPQETENTFDALPQEAEGTFDALPQETENFDSSDIPYNAITYYDASVRTEHSHIQSDSIYLGNEEILTLIVTAKPANLNESDFFFIFDESLLSNTVTKVSSSSDRNETTIEAKISSISPGSSEFAICSTYDLITLGEEADFRVINITGLDYEKGRIVYVTPTGEKYHRTASCAGKNAISTTSYDAIAYEYEKCKKCWN